MYSRKTQWIAAIMASIVALTLIAGTPAVAQEEVCRGGGPGYWMKNAWPQPFRVPKKFQQPRTERTYVRPKTQFDSVFRYRRGRDQEGEILPGKTLRQVLNLKGNPLQGLARQAVSALLNAGEGSNQFGYRSQDIIMEFQVYWDGTSDLGANEARKWAKRQFATWNSEACPVVAPAAS